MSNEKVDLSSEMSHTQSSLRKAIIVFAIVEALVLVPAIIYMLLR